MHTNLTTAEFLRGPAMVIHHPNAKVRLVDPATGAEVDHAKRDSDKEFLWSMAQMFARRKGLGELRMAQADVRKRYLSVLSKAYRDLERGFGL